jgi:hypothetical protein
MHHPEKKENHHARATAFWWLSSTHRTDSLEMRIRQIKQIFIIVILVILRSVFRYHHLSTLHPSSLQLLRPARRRTTRGSMSLSLAGSVVRKVFLEFRRLDARGKDRR